MATNARPINERMDKPGIKSSLVSAPTFKTSETHATSAQAFQRVSSTPNLARAADILQLQRTLGNRAVGALLARSTLKRPLIQAKLPADSSGAKYPQAQNDNPPNTTGLPDKLKSGIESLSGMSMDNVKVHYNSSQPAQLDALAYAQGAEIHLAPGQEQHLPHEAWHVVQQAQGRVKPTMQLKDEVPVNDDRGLEHEADVMGQKALALEGWVHKAGSDPVSEQTVLGLIVTSSPRTSLTIQRKEIQDWGTQNIFQQQRKKLPPLIKLISSTVTDYKITPLGKRTERKEILEILLRFCSYYDEKEAAEKNLTKFKILVKALEVEATTELIALNQKIADFALANQREQAYNQVPPTIAPYARRQVAAQEPDVTPFLPHKFGVADSYPHAFAQARGPNGELTQASIDEADRMHQQELQELIVKSKNLTIDTADKSKSELEKVMAGQLNPLSGKTQFPELKNFTEPSTKASQDVTRKLKVGGLSLQVTYDQSDVTWQARRALVDAAIRKITAKGIAVPPIKIILPKFGRGVKVSGDLAAEHGDRIAPAFKSPDTLLLPPQMVDNPKLEGTATGPFFSSSAVDSNSVGTVVHEFGHFLHYSNAPSRFHSLHDTEWVGDTSAFEREVGAYGMSKPREFVAEVFLGMVYGRAYSQAVMDRYQAFGGKPMGPVQAQGGGAALIPPRLGSGKTVAYPSAAAKALGDARRRKAKSNELKLLRSAAQPTRNTDEATYKLWKSLLRPLPAGAVVDDKNLRIELPYNYQVVREQHREFGKALEDVAKSFFTANEQVAPEGYKYTAKDLAGMAFNDPKWLRARERRARQLLVDARREFAHFDFDAYDQLFPQGSIDELATALRDLPESRKIARLMGGNPKQLLVGESHNDVTSKSFIVNNLDALLKAKVDTLYVEHFRRDDYQALLDDYNTSRGQATSLPAPLAKLIEALDAAHNPSANWPYNLKGAVEIAHRRGLKVMGMDDSGAISRTGELNELRAARMNFVAAEAVKADRARGDVTHFIMLVGEAHIHSHERNAEAQPVPGLSQLLNAPALTAGEGDRKGKMELLKEKASNRGRG